MELKEFIQNAILDITSALNKSSTEMIDAKTGNGIPDAHEIEVNFDIAVTVSNTDINEGGAKISVLGNYFSLQGSKKNSKDIEQYSRISFKVPIKIKTLGGAQYSM